MRRSVIPLQPLPPTSSLLAYASIPSAPLLAYSLVVPVVLSINSVSSLCSPHLVIFLVASYTAAHLFLLFTFSVALHPLPLCHAFHRLSVKLLSLFLLVLLHAAILAHGVLYLLLPAYFPSVLAFPPTLDSECTTSFPFMLAVTGVGLEAAFIVWHLLIALIAQCRLSWWEANPLRRSIEEKQLRAAIAEAKARQAQWLLEEAVGSSTDNSKARAAPDQSPEGPRRDDGGRTVAAQEKPPASVSRATSIKVGDEDEILRFTQRAQIERKRQRESLKDQSQAAGPTTRHVNLSVKAMEREEQKEPETDMPSPSPFLPRASEPENEEEQDEGVQHSGDEDLDSDVDSEEEDKEEKEDGAAAEENDEDDSEELSEEEDDVDGDIPPLPLSARSIPTLPPLPIRSVARGSAAPRPFHPPPSSAPSILSHPILPNVIAPPTPDILPLLAESQAEALEKAVPQQSQGIDQEGEGVKAPPSSEAPLKDIDGVVQGGAHENREAVLPVRRKSMQVTQRSGSGGGGTKEPTVALPIVAVPGARRRPQLIPLLKAPPSMKESPADTATPTEVMPSPSAPPLSEPLLPTALPPSPSSEPSPTPAPASASASPLLPISVVDVSHSSFPPAVTEHPLVEVIVPTDTTSPAHPLPLVLTTSLDEVSDTAATHSGNRPDAVITGTEPVPADSFTEKVGIPDVTVNSTSIPGGVETVEKPEIPIAEPVEGVEQSIPTDEGERTAAASAFVPLESSSSPSQAPSHALVEAEAQLDLPVEVKAPAEPAPVLPTTLLTAPEAVPAPVSEDGGGVPSLSAAPPASSSPVSTARKQHLHTSPTPSPATSEASQEQITTSPTPVAHRPSHASMESEGWEEQLNKAGQVHPNPPIDLGGEAVLGNGDTTEDEAVAADPPSIANSSSSIVKAVSLSERPSHEQRLIVELQHEQEARRGRSSSIGAITGTPASVMEGNTAEEVKEDIHASVEEDVDVLPAHSTTAKQREEEEEEVEWSEERKDEAPSPTLSPATPASVPTVQVKVEVEVETSAVLPTATPLLSEASVVDATPSHVEEAFII